MNRLLLCCLIALASSSLVAQTETGQITGTLTDPSGSAVPGAKITVRSLATGATRVASSAADGSYNVTNLLPDEYAVTVNAAGFAAIERKLRVAVGTRVGQDFRLELASASATVDINESSVRVDTETQTLAQVISQNEIRELPNLTRNPYQFVALAGNVSDAGLGTRGAGVSINGQRESSTNILLDGGSNNDEYNGKIGQQVPLDAVQEFSVLTSNFTAEYGRASGGVVNVATKAGSNEFHGTAYEFNRVSRLSSNGFQNNATGAAKSVFNRNQFGYSAGGPVIKNKLFFFSSTEWIRVRSDATIFAWVPTPELIAQTPSNVQAFFQQQGGLRSSASQFGTISRRQFGSDPCAGLPCASLPMNLPLFSHVSYRTPTDAGGGFPQNTYMTVNRVDYNLSEKTQLYGRFALYSESDSVGVLSNSPYSDYDLGQTFFNHNGLFSVIHTFSPTLVSQSKVVFNRLTNFQPGLTSRGLVPTMYANTTGPVAIGADLVAFPGYNPFTPGNGGAAGGPQNLLQFYQDFSYSRRGHSLRFGGTYVYQRDNRTFAAYQTASDGLAGQGGLGPAVSALLAGTFNDINVAVDPQGKFPCAVNPTDCSVKLPVDSPNFSRSNRYHEFAFYGQDSWKVRPNFTLNLGLRWEYFGTQHNKNSKLDANWYAPSSVGFADDNLGQYIRQGGLQLAPSSSMGKLWNAQLTNFAPRIGFAWNVFGDGRTSVRGGYGIGYERNFGNVTFNIIQNPPNYAVLAVPGPISSNNFGPLVGNTGSLALPRVGARIVNPDIRTAHAHMWNLSFERQLSRSAFWSAEYSGSKGVDLYSISYPNQAGFGNFALGDPCTGLQPDGTTTCASRPSTGYGNSIGYRGNQGFSIYHALNNRFRVSNLFRSGLDFTLNYTWAHAIDNLSSTFFETGVSGQYGNTNVTVNNGSFDRGILDPFHPGLDRGNAEFDIRQRVTMLGTWRIPTGSIDKGLAGLIAKGWSLNPLFIARTGQPYSIFDTSVQQLPYNAPRATFVGSVPNGSNGLTATATPNTYNYLSFTDAQISHIPMSFAPGSAWPTTMTARNAFRAPGWWNLDFGVYKDTRITERTRLQLRFEVFNLFNHANLYVVGSSADVGTANAVTACFGCTGSTYDRRHMQLGAKFIF